MYGMFLKHPVVKVETLYDKQHSFVLKIKVSRGYTKRSIEQCEDMAQNHCSCESMHVGKGKQQKHPKNKRILKA